MTSDRETVLLVGQNLFFAGKVEAMAEPQGYELKQAKTGSVFWETYGDRRPALILVDLEGDESTWSGVLEKIDHQDLATTQIVAFGPHEQVDTLEKARNLGCHLVLNKGEFNRDLSKIIGGIKINSD